MRWWTFGFWGHGLSYLVMKYYENVRGPQKGTGTQWVENPCPEADGIYSFQFAVKSWDPKVYNIGHKALRRWTEFIVQAIVVLWSPTPSVPFLFLSSSVGTVYHMTHVHLEEHLSARLNSPHSRYAIHTFLFLVSFEVSYPVDRTVKYPPSVSAVDSGCHRHNNCFVHCPYSQFF
jgi:hypothetical protein